MLLSGSVAFNTDNALWRATSVEMESENKFYSVQFNLTVIKISLPHKLCSFAHIYLFMN